MQRVDGAHVTVDDAEVGRIGPGLLVYLGVGKTDSEKDVAYLAEKVAGLRIFPDDTGAMNRSIVDMGGSALVISQFTLFGDVRRGRRPSFASAMAPEAAVRIYERFIAALKSFNVPCSSGRFGAMMEVSAVNNGPVTILIDSAKCF